MAREKRAWHQDFIDYMNKIVNHANYKTLPDLFKADGSIRWVVSGNSELGKKRAKWWDDQVKKLREHNRAEVARKIHPKEMGGMKPCQICGKKLSIFYVYPNKNTLKSIKKLTNLDFNSYEKTISEIFDIIKSKKPDSVFQIFSKLFKIPDEIEKNKQKHVHYVEEHCKTKLSPGVMSNPPDRLDGFHTYNGCCRSKEDTGRHSSNLARYSQDRRAYENWADGNWNYSNRLMGEFQRYKESVICPGCGKLRKMTADHIGPISLGFTHRPKFNPLCKSCNSGKNNRITYEDVLLLKEDEEHGHKIVSWHSKFVWDKLKNKVKNEEDALNLSKAMRLNLHNVLSIFSLIKDNGHKGFLIKFLHPEYSFYDYKFKNFHPLKLNELDVIKKPLESKNKEKNAERYVRISFDSLDNYKNKVNRRVKDFYNKELEKSLRELLSMLDLGNYKDSYEKLERVIEFLSEEAIKDFF